MISLFAKLEYSKDLITTKFVFHFVARVEEYFSLSAACPWSSHQSDSLSSRCFVSIIITITIIIMFVYHIHYYYYNNFT